MKKQKLINVSLVGLIGKEVKGLRAQIRNPRYLGVDMPAQWRTLTKLKTYKEKGKDWVELSWKKESDDSCNFTGSTIERDLCVVQFEETEFAKLKQIKTVTVK